MSRLILFLLILILSVWLGLEVVRHPGYLLVVYQPWIMQMPIWFALLSLLFTFGIFYLVITSIDRIQFFFYRCKNWFNFRREHLAYSKTQFGLSALIEGNFKKAERLLIAGVNQALDPFINYLGAAKAAHEGANYERRDTYIQKAYALAPKADMAIGLTQAELELDQGQLEQAQATLNRLFELDSRHPRVLKLLEKVYVRLGDFERLNTLIPNMRKAKILKGDEVVRFEKNIYVELLNSPKNHDLASIENIWQSIPRQLKKHPDLVYCYSKQLLRFHASLKDIDPKKSAEIQKEVEELIRKTLNHTWKAGLVDLYSTLSFTNLNRQLVIAGAWLKLYGDKPELLLLLGKLCVQIQLWGKAKDYFEKCLSAGPNSEASYEYGKLLEQLGERDGASQIYRDGLIQCRKLDVKKNEYPY